MMAMDGHTYISNPPTVTGGNASLANPVFLPAGSVGSTPITSTVSSSSSSSSSIMIYAIVAIAIYFMVK